RLADKIQQFLLGTLTLGAGLYEAVSSEFEIRQLVRSRYANPSRVTPAQITELHERAMRRHAIYGYISHLTGHLTADLARWLRYVRCEVLVLWGEHAGPVPAEIVLQPATWSKGKRIELIPDAARWPHVEQSAKANSALITFLNPAS